jgi:hypothetical protein
MSLAIDLTLPRTSFPVSSYYDVRPSLSCPLLRLLFGDIGFVYPVMSMVVIGPSLPILRQRHWSLLYDVY